MNVAEREAVAAAAKIGSGLIACPIPIFVIIFSSVDALKFIVYVSRAAP